MSRWLSAGGFLISTFTLAATCPTVSPDTVPNGAWGGDHIGMVVTDTGATMEYDCAAGKITDRMNLNSRGDFDVRGVHYPGHGGPVRIDEPRNEHTARYTGHATSAEMTITLQLTDTVFSPQTFHLVFGQSPHVFKCL